MAFIWRRRSTSIVKIVAVLTVIWFTIVFLLYTDDTRRAAKWNGMSLGFKGDGGGGGGGEPGGGGRANGDESEYFARAGVVGGAGAAADVPMAANKNVDRGGMHPVETVIDANKRDINNGDESVIDNVVVQPHEKEAFKGKKHIAGRGKYADSKSKHKQSGDEDKGVLSAPGIKNDAPGEMGKPVVLPANLTAEIKKLVDDGWTNNAFNQYASDLISVHRSLPDPREPWCKESAQYLPNLPQTDVIICFHNEAWSVLLRTVHSVLDRSPDHLIGKVILVDDFSDMPHTKRQLEDYFKGYPKVKIVRAPKREGLIRARLLGARNAESSILTFLDSHCECAEGWLEPLIDRIARNSTTVVCPVIDVIDDETMEYHYHDSTSLNVGGFDWNLQFNWHAVPDREKSRHKVIQEPVYSPTMAGGLFSIDKLFFDRLGTYDSGFDIWGGENLEISFKTWMCGGTLEIIPCSHVGHIFRKRSPYKWRSGVNVLKKNSVRLAEVWMDDYAKYYYQRIGNDKGDFGDVSARKELRKRLGCKSFEWYLKNIYPELFIPGEAVAYGEIRNLGYGGRTCLDSPARKKDLKKAVGLYPCHNQGGNQIRNKESTHCLDADFNNTDEAPLIVWGCHGTQGNQYFMFSKAGEIRRDEACVDYAGTDVMLFPCHGSKGNQFWTYNVETSQLRHGSSEKCLAINEKRDKAIMEECDPNQVWQRWHLENYDASKL